MSSALAVYEGVRNKLLADANITALVASRIFNRVPQDDNTVGNITEYPFIAINVTNNPVQLIKDTEFNHTVTIQCWTVTTMTDVITLRNLIYGALNRQTLTVDAPYTFNYCSVLPLIDAFVEPDNKTYQGIVKFEVDLGID